MLSVLIAVHGYEPSNWTRDAARVLLTWGAARVRVLGVVHLPYVPYTSLTPAGRRLYAMARAAWARQEEARLQPEIDTVCRVLPHGVDVVRVASERGDVAATIAAHARDWPADVVVVAAPRPGLRTWVSPGPVHAQVMREAPCPVLVLPKRAPEQRLRPRLLPVGRPAAREV